MHKTKFDDTLDCSKLDHGVYNYQQRLVVHIVRQCGRVSGIVCAKCSVIVHITRNVILSSPLVQRTECPDNWY